MVIVLIRFTSVLFNAMPPSVSTMVSDCRNDTDGSASITTEAYLL